MSATMVTLISWAPFLVFALIFGIIFAVKGYKRGSARAGISVAVTAIACVISIIISKPVATSLAGLVSPLIGELFSGSGMTTQEATVIRELTFGIASAVCAVLIYTPIFIILISVLKPLVSHIIKRFFNAPVHPVNKIGGLAVSIVDAVLLSILITLPLYGTLSLAGKIAELSDDGDRDVELVSAAADPFVVDLAGLPPFSTAYDSLMTFKVSNTKINISGTVRGAVEIAGDIKLLGNISDGSFEREIAVKILNGSEDFLLQNEFITDLLCGYMTGKDLSFDVEGIGKIDPCEYYPALTDSNLLRGDIVVFFDLAEAAVNSGMIEALASEDADLSNVDVEMISKAFGYTLNYSSSIFSLKNKLVNTVVDVLSKDAGADNDENKAIAAIKDAVAAIAEKRLENEEAEKEGEALYLLVSGIIASQDERNAIKGFGLLIEGIARHPMIGADKIVNTMDVLLSGYSIKVTDELVTSIENNLRLSLEKPIRQSTFSQYCDMVIRTFDIIVGVANVDNTGIITGNTPAENFEKIIVADAEVLEAVNKTVSEDILNGFGIKDKKQTEVFEKFFDAILDVVKEEEYNSKEAEKEAEALENILSIVSSVSQKPQSSNKIIKENAQNMIDQCLESKTVKNMLTNLTAGGKSDPLGIFTNLTSKTKDSVNKTIDSYISKVSDKSDIDVLNALKLFIGVQK